jgi:hypothetical protein
MAFCRPSGVMITPSHFSVRGRRWEVGTTTNGGVLRLFARFQFAEDRCVGRLLAVKCGHRGITTMRGRLLEPTPVATHPSWRRARRLIRVSVAHAALRLPQQLAPHPVMRRTR